MDIQTKQLFDELSHENKIRALALLSHGLTILARDTYEVGTDGITDPARLRRCNEAQHAVANAMIHVLDKTLDSGLLLSSLDHWLESSEVQSALKNVFRYLAR